LNEYKISKNITELTKMSNNKDTQLTTASGYDINRMIFSEPQHGNIPDTTPPINFKRILISTRNEDGTIGDLIIPTQELFSFGVSENVNPESGKVNGYVMPLCLYGKDGASSEEKAWVETFNNIIENCKKHILDVKDEIEQYDLERGDLKKFNPLYYKKEKGKIIPGSSPTLYAKLIVSKKNDNRIVTLFYDKNGEEINGLDLLGKFGHATTAVKFESIFIGNKISLQIKLHECIYTPMQTGMKRLLARPKANNRVLTSHTINKAPIGGDDGDDNSNEGSDLGSDDDNEKPKKAPVKKKVVRRVKRVAKKAN
jgi:hypothetical protein